MSIASKIVERFRVRLSRFVAKEHAKTGCRKTAIRNAARKVGMGAIGIYRAMNGYGNVRIEARHYVALLMASMKPAKSRSARILTPENRPHAGLNA